MNCKPGDLAVIVKTGSEGSTPNIGRLVNVQSSFGDGKSWWIKAIDDRPLLSAWGSEHFEVGAYDSSLRPIRDPGEDAKDETLFWLDVPKREGQPA